MIQTPTRCNKKRFINNSNQLNMLRASIPPIFRSTRLCVTACGIMHPRRCRPARKLSANLYDILVYLLLCVQWRTPYDGQRNCPKHVDFHSKNKFKKLEHLVGFIIRKVIMVSFIILIIFVTSAKQKYKIRWRWCKCIAKCRRAYDI